jgi:hypothetical protein
MPLKRKNPEHSWSTIQKAAAVNEKIALAMDELSDAIKGAMELLSVYKREQYNAHTIRLLEADVASSTKALSFLDKAYDSNQLKKWTFRK